MSGDAEAERAFHDFVAARATALSRTAYLLTGDHHLAEDLLQTALFKAAKSWHRIDGDPEPYVRRILYHENISGWRRRKHGREYAVAEHRDQAQPVYDVELKLSLEAALARLTEKQRTVLVLRYYEDLTEVQVAATLGIAVGTVKSTTRQALGRLRALSPHLAELVGDPA